ncbi:MAG: hypothetical protein QM765_28735 [Myxococcales bacterium]
MPSGLPSGGALSSVLVVSLALAATTPARADSPLLALDADESLACPSSDLLLKALEQRFGEQHVTRAKGPATSVLVRLAEESLLEIVLSTDGAVTQRRSLQVNPNECPQLSQTVALLVDAWLRDAPWRIAVLAVPPSPAPVAAPQAGDPPPRTARPRRPNRTVPVLLQASGEATADTPAPADPAPLAAERPAEQTQAEQTPGFAESAPPTLPQVSPAVRSELAFEPSLAGGVFFDPSAGRMGGHGTLCVEGAWRGQLRFGVQLLLETPVSVPVGPGTISAHSQALAATLAWAPYHSDSSGLDLLLGGGVEMLSAKGAGYTVDLQQTVFQPALLGGLRWRLRLWGPLYAVAMLEARMRLHQQQIRVEGVTSALSLAPVSPSLVLGLLYVNGTQ